MGAGITLTPVSGVFDLGALKSFIFSIRGATPLKDKPHWFLLSEMDNLPIQEIKPEIHEKDLQNERHFAFRLPVVQIRSQTQFSAWIDWTDTREHGVKKILTWMLSKYECSGEDHDGYKYENSERCKEWMKNWLP